MMKPTVKAGLSFGLTSGIITTLGLIVGLYSGTHSKLPIIGGILIIAIADAFSDALGMHISQEAEARHTVKEIWESTISTFLAKFFFALTFIFPILLFSLKEAIIASIIWGLALLGIFSFYLARKEQMKPAKVIAEHLLITCLVVAASTFAGILIRTIFG